MNLLKTSLVSPAAALLLCANLTAAELYTVENQSLKQAIDLISKKAKLPYIVSGKLLEGKVAKDIKNVEGPQNALNKVLQSSGLKAIIEDGAIIIKRKSLSTTKSSDLGNVEVIESLNNVTQGQNTYTIASMNTATKMDLSILETPQTVTVITNEKMKDFSLNTINDVLTYAPGITVEKHETDRTKYTSRGFDISNFQVDGINVPLNVGTDSGNADTALYDHIEITKGATGLMSGAGDPSATVNMIRKKPTKEFQASASLTTGSWNKIRSVADVSGSLNEDKSVRARMVVSKENSDSYLDRYEIDKSLFYSVIEADLSDSTLLTFGYTKTKENPKSPLWGSLPLYYTNGTATNFDRSASTSANWSYWDLSKTEIFADINHHLTNKWQIKATIQKIDKETDSNLFYIYGTPNAETQAGLTGYGSKYTDDVDEIIADVHLKGSYMLRGYENTVVFGLASAKRDTTEKSLYDYTTGNGFPAIADLSKWDGNTPYPTFKDSEAGGTYSDKELAIYGATNIHLNDSLSLVLGGRLSNWETTGESYGTDKSTKDTGIFTPYTGLVYNINDTTMAYASYTTSFTPQAKVDINEKQLNPTEAVNYEIGTKSTFFDGALNTSFALFKVEQTNALEKGGKLSNGRDYYISNDGITSKGYELEVSGEVMDNLQLSLGYTNLKIEDNNGNHAKTYVPEQTIKLATAYTLESLPKLKIGASANWQDKTFRDQGTATEGPNSGTTITSTQKAYTLVNLMANYEINKNLSASLNINNVTDEKYLSSLYWAQSFYGTPRSAYVTFKWKY